MRVMRLLSMQVFSLCCALGCAPALSAGTGSPPIKCIAATDQAAVGLKNYLVRLITSRPGSDLDSSRIQYQLPTGTAGSVVLQTSKTLCTQAGQAYHNVVAPGAAQIARTVAVFKVGANRYVVLDPAQRYGEYYYNVVFDLSFTKVAAFTG